MAHTFSFLFFFKPNNIVAQWDPPLGRKILAIRHKHELEMGHTHFKIYIYIHTTMQRDFKLLTKFLLHGARLIILIGLIT